MQTNFIKHLFTAVLLLCCSVSFAQQFEIKGLYYNVIDTNQKWVEVSGSVESSLSRVIVPRNVTWRGVTYTVKSIAECGFMINESLTGIILPNSVTSIGWNAFAGCEYLQSITIPASVTSIEGDAFGIVIWDKHNDIVKTCSRLVSIKIDPNNPVYDSRNNCNAIIETSTNTLIYGCQSTVIPSSVTHIGDMAYFHCKSLKSITIPNGVKSIGDGAFTGCDNLKTITLPRHIKNVKYLGLPKGCKIIWR